MCQQRLCRSDDRSQRTAIQPQAEQPAFFVAKYLQAAGVEIVPVPTFYPEVTHILGTRVIRDLRAVPGNIDILDVFRRPTDLEAHVEDIIALKPAVVWLQTGIRNPGVEAKLAGAGLTVVADRCLMVEHRQAGPASSL